MNRRKFVQLTGLSATAVSIAGFRLIEENNVITTDCATSTDLLGPFFRKKAPFRHDLYYSNDKNEIPIKVVGNVFGADCKTPLPNVLIDIWHCDHEEEYDMKSDEHRCRGRFHTDAEGAYWFQTFIPPPYAGRPKHIHYLVHETEGHQKLITQLYFKGDKNIKPDNWIKYPWDERRILDIYQNEDGVAEVKLDLFLSPVA